MFFSPDIHYSIFSDLHSPNLPAASCQLAMQRRAGRLAQRRAGGAYTGPRMRRTTGGAHLLTNLSHGRELVQFVASLLKSDK